MHLQAALAAGALDATVPDLAALARARRSIAIALPVDATVAALASTPALAQAELVFDVASVKAPVVAAAAGLPHFVASHPLAGRERGGFAAADATLFEGRTWAVVPARDPAAQPRLEELVGRARRARADRAAADHDRLVAVSSHLPQLVSVALGAELAAAGDADPRVYESVRTGYGIDAALGPFRCRAVGADRGGQCDRRRRSVGDARRSAACGGGRSGGRKIRTAASGLRRSTPGFTACHSKEVRS